MSCFIIQKHTDTENRPKVIQYVFISVSEKLKLCIKHAEMKEKHKYSTMTMKSTVSKWK